MLSCITSKAGCTTWKTVLEKSIVGDMDKKYNVDTHKMLEQYGLRRLNTYTIQDINYIRKNYFKFIVVRHPFERLVSAYREKFGNPKGVQKHFEMYIPYITNNEQGSNVMFSKFVDNLIYIHNVSKKLYNGLALRDYIESKRALDPKTLRYISEGVETTFTARHLKRGSKYYNGHWAQYATVCHPCYIHYDVKCCMYDVMLLNLIQ